MHFTVRYQLHPRPGTLLSLYMDNKVAWRIYNESIRAMPAMWVSRATHVEEPATHLVIESSLRNPLLVYFCVFSSLV